VLIDVQSDAFVRMAGNAEEDDEEGESGMAAMECLGAIQVSMFFF
jgi:hypothetical protein